MPNLSYRRRLRLFAKDEGSDNVLLSLWGVVDLPGGGEHLFLLPDEQGSDAALTTHAGGPWSEDDICALHDCERGVQPQPPAVPDADAPPPPDVPPQGPAAGMGEEPAP